MAISCTSTVKLTINSKNPSSGTLSGTASILDGATSLATIPASGSPTKGTSNFSAGSNNGWTLYVTWNSDGTVTGSANNGAGSSTNVPITVDHPGKPHHQHAPGQQVKK